MDLVPHVQVDLRVDEQGFCHRGGGIEEVELERREWK